MNKDWEVKKLGEVCEFERGLTYSKKDEVAYSSNVVLRANNIDLNTNSLNFDELKYINDNIKIPARKKVSRGSLIICTASGSKNHLGKIAFIDRDYDYAFGGFMGKLTPKQMIYPMFLFYKLTSDTYKAYIHKLADGININNLKFDDLTEYPIPLPPLPTQQRIVAILDEAFDAIAKAQAITEKNLQNAREIFESYLDSVFANPKEDWEEKRLGDLFHITSSKRVFEADWKRNGVPFYRAREIVKLAQNGFIDNELFISEEMFNMYATKYGIPAEGDLMVTGVGTLGICYVVKKSDRFYFKDGNIIWLKKKSDVNSFFIEYGFKSDFLRKQIDDSVGATVGTYTIIKAKNTIIPLPPLPTQQVIVAKLDELSAETKRLEAIYQKKLADLEELKKAILQKAFNGELC